MSPDLDTKSLESRASQHSLAKPCGLTDSVDGPTKVTLNPIPWTGHCLWRFRKYPMQ